VDVRAFGSAAGVGGISTDVTGHRDLIWQSDNPAVVRADGPTLTAIGAGDATLMARLGKLTATAEVVVAAEQSPAPAALSVSPQSLRLQADESRSLGRDIRVTRGGVDLTRDVKITSSQPDLLKVDRKRNSITGVSPGEAALVFTHDEQRVTVPVTIDPSERAQGAVAVEVEPAVDTLASGESRNLRVFAVADGTRVDRTGSAILRSSDEKVLAVRGTQVVGRSPGSATISAELPESDTAGVARFTVLDEEFTSLVVIPRQIVLAKGDQQEIRVQGVGPAGRREMSEHPQLKFSVSGANPAAVAIRGNTVRGLAAGTAVIDVSWDESLAEQVAVEVVEIPWRDLRIEPANVVIGEGEERGLVVLAKLGDEQRAVTIADGLTWRSDNPAVAVVDKDGTVTGTAPGFASITARLGELSAAAQLTVEARLQPAPPDDPARPSPGLRFIPDVLSLQLGTPGASVRVVKVLPDGREEDVDHRTKMEFEGPADVASKEWTASGPVFKPLKLGITRIRATHEGVATMRPMVITVVDEPLDAELVVRPSPITLRKGEALDLQQVRLHPGRGRAPVDVQYRVSSTDEAIVAIEAGRRLRGVAADETTIVVVPTDVDNRFKDVDATIAVRVIDSSPPDGSARLVLSGPEHTTVGATAQFQIMLESDQDERDVTSDGAVLVLDRDQAEYGDVSPGGMLVAKFPGTINVKARYKDQISNAVRLRIDNAATQFEELKIEIDSRPFVLNESRPYKLWGHPLGGGPPQDLTDAVISGKPVTRRLTPESGPLKLEPSKLVAKKAGNAKFQAGFQQADGKKLVASIDLGVIDEGDRADAILSADPASIVVKVGQRAPPVSVLAQHPGEPAPRRIDAQFTSDTPGVLSPEAESGWFKGVLPGQAKLIAKVGDQQVEVDAEVVENLFEKVDLGRPEFGAGFFKVPINIEGTFDGKLEFRVSLPGADRDAGWIAASGQGGKLSAQLKSPELPLKTGLRYELLLEARTPEGEVLERYPCFFYLRPGK